MGPTGMPTDGCWLDTTGSARQSAPMASRLEIWRGYMKRLEPSASAEIALKEGYYVAPPEGGMSQRLAARLELAPDSKNLLIGGIGSGKTTELLKTQEKLRAAGDIQAYYIDVSLRQDLSQIKPGVLLTLAAEALAGPAMELQPEDPLVVRIKKKLRGYTDYDYPDDYEDDSGRDIYEVWVPPVITPPPQDPFVTKSAEFLRAVQNAFAPSTAVILFDALDRLTDLAVLRSLLSRDMRALAQAGVGSVIVGPPPALYGLGRDILELVDEYSYLAPASFSILDDPQFMAEVLWRRVPQSVFPEESAAILAESSGGVLRDLLTLGQRAVEEAYVMGGEVVSKHHVARSVRAFGRKLLLGLDRHDLELLRKVQKTGKFLELTESDFSLLLSRRVLDQGDGQFIVHPAIADLVAQVAA